MSQYKLSLLAITVTCLLGASGDSAWVHAKETSVFAEIDQVYIPPEGFDDNDEIQFVIEGWLPGPCYQLARSTVKVSQRNREINVKQKLRRRKIPMCDQNPEQLQGWPVRFNQVHTLGALKAGSYTIRYGKELRSQTQFEVSVSNSRQVDDYLYAPISRVFVPDLVYSDQEVQVILSGVIEQSCLRLAGVDQMVSQDVVVLLPRLEILPGAPCKEVQRPIQSLVNIGKLTEGRYLLQVRSMSGQAVHQIFLVGTRPMDPRKEESNRATF